MQPKVGPLYDFSPPSSLSRSPLDWSSHLPNNCPLSEFEEKDLVLLYLFGPRNEEPPSSRVFVHAAPHNRSSVRCPRLPPFRATDCPAVPSWPPTSQRQACIKFSPNPIDKCPQVITPPAPLIPDAATEAGGGKFSGFLCKDKDCTNGKQRMSPRMRPRKATAGRRGSAGGSSGQERASFESAEFSGIEHEQISPRLPSHFLNRRRLSSGRIGGRGGVTSSRSFPYSVKQQCWEKAEKVKGRYPDRWRRDPLGNIIF
ncbi:hypothetical protein KSP40_PGU008577 [Platanthera guangdongensis]|uniref:Uncharacterized protein n=1 Tax=Platanthera guangdongensis TaxID=2320717 RepID=A0ABR2M9A0_9ASPA